MIRVKVLEQPPIHIETKANVTVSDGGYERGYAAGYEVGNTEGYSKGHTEGVAEGYAEGLAARTYETWTITLADGTVVEKEVALL